MSSGDSVAGVTSGTRVICTLATGPHLELLAESEPTLRAYGDRWEWAVEVRHEALPDRPPSWSKIPFIRQLLDRHEYVWWIDADALFVDINHDVLAEIDDSADVWLAHHAQEHDEQASVPNGGVMVMRSTPFSRAFFDAIWDLDEYTHHNWWENAALLDLLGCSLDPPFPVLRETRWQERVGRLDLAWNSVPGYDESPAPVINHHARSDHDDFQKRLAGMAADREALLGPHVPPSSGPLDGLR